MEDRDQIRLTLPARAGFARVARLAMTGLASRNGFSYEEVEDLRIATGELFGVLVEPEAAEGRLVFTCTLPDPDLVIEAARHPAVAPLELGDLSRQILEAVTDDLVVDVERGTLRIQKRPGDQR